MPLPLGQRQTDDGVGHQERRRIDLLDEQALGTVYGENALRILSGILEAGVPMVEGEADEQVEITFEHLVATDKAADLFRLNNNNNLIIIITLKGPKKHINNLS